MTWLEENLGYLITLSGVLIAAVVVYALLNKKFEEKLKKTPIEARPMDSFSRPSVRSFLSGDVEKARRDLRILDVEKDIYSYAIRHLYEAYASGGLTEEERDKLVAEYKERMNKINDAISRNQSIIALNELEQMKEDLFKMFNERFDDIERRIKEIKTRLGIKVLEEPPLHPVEVPTAEVKVETSEEEEKEMKKKVKKPRPPPPPELEESEADEKIKHIRDEVEKVLEKLGQIEV